MNEKGKENSEKLNNKTISRITTAASAILLMIFIICFSVTVILHSRFIYYNDLDSLNIPENSGYTKEQCINAYDELIDYNSLTGPSELKFSEFAMSESGEKHFREVKVIFIAMEIAMFVSAALLIPLVIYLVRRKKFGFLIGGGGACIGITLALGAFIAIAWDRLFVLFHEVVFQNNDWIFDYHTDPIILILPDEFFMHAAIGIIGLVIILSLIAGGSYFVLRKRFKNAGTP